MSHWNKVSGVNGLFVGPDGAEIAVASATGVLYDQGARLVPASQKVEKFATLSITHATSGLATGVAIATIPAGSIITSLACKIDTVWNSGTSDAVSIGYGAGLNELVSAQNAQALGLTTLVTNAIPMVRSAETIVKVKVAVAGTTATTGAATIVMGYI